MTTTTFFKTGFYDYLYFIFYEVDIINDTFTREIEDKYEAAITACKFAQFRFENKLMFTEEALTHENYLYGFFHLAKIQFKEDFKQLNQDFLIENITSFLESNISKRVPFNKKSKSINIIKNFLTQMLDYEIEVFELDISNPILNSKRAPFGYGDFFKSYLLFHKGNERIFSYIELGSD